MQTKRMPEAVEGGKANIINPKSGDSAVKALEKVESNPSLQSIGPWSMYPVAEARISEMWRMGRGPRSLSTSDAMLQFSTHPGHRRNSTTYFCNGSTSVGAWGDGKREAKLLHIGEVIKSCILPIVLVCPHRGMNTLQLHRLQHNGL